MTDADLAAYLAETAGRLLLTVRDSAMLEGSALGKAGDAVANQFLVRALHAQRPNDAVLSEEESDNHERLSHRRVWIIDPVDGTREYGERRADWAVHVALAIDGVPVTGAVALPDARGGIVIRSDRPSPLPPAPATLRMVVSRTRPAPEALAVAQAIGAELVPMGSAGAKAMSVILGDADIYLHSGGQYEWDSCAPSAVCLRHGLHVSRLDGGALVYNRSDPYVPDLLMCRREHAARVLDVVAGVRCGGG